MHATLGCDDAAEPSMAASPRSQWLPSPTKETEINMACPTEDTEEEFGQLEAFY